MAKSDLEKMKEYVQLCLDIESKQKRKTEVKKFVSEDWSLKNEIEILEKKRKYLQDQTPFIDGHKYNGVKTKYTERKLKELKKKILFLKDDFWKSSFLFDRYFLDDIFYTSEDGTHFILELHYNSSFDKFQFDKLVKQLQKELKCRLDDWHISVGYNNGVVVWISLYFVDEELIKKLNVRNAQK